MLEFYVNDDTDLWNIGREQEVGLFKDENVRDDIGSRKYKREWPSRQWHGIN